MQLSIDRRTDRMIRPIIYTTNFAIIVKACLKLHRALNVLTAMYQIDNLDHNEQGNIAKYIVEAIGSMMLIYYSITFSINIEIVYDMIVVYTVMSLYIIFKPQCSFIFIGMTILGLQSFIDWL